MKPHASAVIYVSGNHGIRFAHLLDSIFRKARIASFTVVPSEQSGPRPNVVNRRMLEGYLAVPGEKEGITDLFPALS